MTTRNWRINQQRDLVTQKGLCLLLIKEFRSDNFSLTRFIKRFTTPIFIVLGLIAAGCVATAIIVPIVFANKTDSTSASTSTAITGK